MGKVRSWEVSDEFWSRVEPLRPAWKRPNEGSYKRKPGGGRKLMNPAKRLKASCSCFAQAASGKPFQRNGLAAQVQCTNTSASGSRPDSSCSSGGLG